MKPLALIAVAGAWLLAHAIAAPAEPSVPWTPPTLLSAREVELLGAPGAALQKGVARLAQEPFTVDWLLADVSFKTSRIFTNYSGDASGRFLELAALTSPRGQFSPPSLRPVMESVAACQKADGHFGLEMDFAKPLVKLSPPIPMLWGNGRLLVGLVTAAQEYKDTNLLAAAKRLGDFYVRSAEQLCSPTREAEYRATGTYGDGYTCCYFPGIEGLAMLYRVTREERYLQQAKRMAEFFFKFDVLPVEHSHGNLCAWRGVLELYDLTRDPIYLERARAKWDAAVRGGFVWALGGIGEHWNVFFEGDEGCSESDWLRFNLDLWRFTGNVRYLEMAERLIANQYPANQCQNGGYGMRHFDGDAAGPIATRGAVDEWPFCCSFHGPLGLHFLKGYLAAGSEKGIYVNFPLSFRASLQAGGHAWRLAVGTAIDSATGLGAIEVDLAPADGAAAAATTTLWLRLPPWASNVRLASAAGHTAAPAPSSGYLRLEREFKAGEKLVVTFRTQLQLESRRFQPVRPAFNRVTQWNDVSALCGPEVLFATPATNTGRLILLATVTSGGQVEFPKKAGGGYWTVALPELNATTEQINAALESAAPVALRPWSESQSPERAAFAHNLVVVPANNISKELLTQFAARVAQRSKGPTAKP